jgi:hypothetical protein
VVLLTFPNDIKSDFNGYDYFISIINIVEDIEDSEVIFDFNNVSFFEANLAALLGTCLEMLMFKRNTFKIINLNRNVETILRKNNFLVELGYGTIIDNYSTSLKYMKFDPNDDEGFNDYIKQQLLSKTDFPAISPQLYKEILRNIFEIYENARTHGKCDFIHTCGQFFPRKPNKPLHFTLVDKGVNIKQNVSDFLKRDISASDAIEWAMIKGNTTKTDTSGGLGLAVIFEFIKLNRGKIQIVSADGFYEFRNDIITKNNLNSYFDGTIVTIIFNFNDSNYYSLVSEKKDLKNFF